MRNRMRRTAARMTVTMAAALLAACTTLNCPLNNTTMAKYMLRGTVTTLTDTLTVTTRRSLDGSDTVLVNRQTATDSLMLPMSYASGEDVLYFTRSTPYGTTTRDTVTITKTDEPHFESIDCNPSFFHTINGVGYTTNGIDSIVIHHRNVTYDASKTHFYIYFSLLD